jgi:anti-sigma factor RsiW
MISCQSIQEDLTAWIDGELSAGRADVVRQHVTECTTCRDEAESLRVAIKWHRQALVHAIALDDFDPTPLRWRLDRAVRREEERGWRWVWRPVAFAGAALAAAAGILIAIAGGPGAVLIPIGLESPPVAVRQEPDLFENYPLIQRLDLLEHFDTVESVPIEDEQGTENG